MWIFFVLPPRTSVGKVSLWLFCSCSVSGAAAMAEDTIERPCFLWMSLLDPKKLVTIQMWPCKCTQQPWLTTASFVLTLHLYIRVAVSIKVDLRFWKSMRAGHIYFPTVDLPPWGEPGPLPTASLSHLALPALDRDQPRVLTNIEHNEELSKDKQFCSYALQFRLASKLLPWKMNG